GDDTIDAGDQQAFALAFFEQTHARRQPLKRAAGERDDRLRLRRLIRFAANVLGETPKAGEKRHECDDRRPEEYAAHQPSRAAWPWKCPAAARAPAPATMAVSNGTAAMGTRSTGRIMAGRVFSVVPGMASMRTITPAIAASTPPATPA